MKPLTFLESFYDVWPIIQRHFSPLPSDLASAGGGGGGGGGEGSASAFVGRAQALGGQLAVAAVVGGGFARPSDRLTAKCA